MSQGQPVSPLLQHEPVRGRARGPPGDPGDDSQHGALLGFLGDELVGLASYETAGPADTAEVAFVVADKMHDRGVATLLLEHLVSLARAHGVRMFTASTLPENSAMLRVFADAGLSATRRLNDGVVELTMPIPGSAALGESSTYLDAVAEREQRADVASLEPLFAPRSVAVIGAGRPGQLDRPVRPAEHPPRGVHRLALRGEPAPHRYRGHSLGGVSQRAA